MVEVKKAPNLKVMMVDMNTAPIEKGSYREEFAGMGTGSVGRTDTAGMSKGDIKNAIDRAYLDGELTSEQARKAHIQLDVKGHLTAEQIAFIEKDRAKN